MTGDYRGEYTATGTGTGTGTGAAAMDAVELDCTELKCPMPIVRIALTIKQLDDGAMLAVTATDSAFLPDVRAWIEMTGHELVSVEDGTVKRALIRNRGQA